VRSGLESGSAPSGGCLRYLQRRPSPARERNRSQMPQSDAAVVKGRLALAVIKLGDHTFDLHEATGGVTPSKGARIPSLDQAC